MTNKAIVSYVGGYGGDVFSTLLLSNFEGGVVPVLSAEQTVDEFLNRYSAPVDFCRAGRGINDFFKLITNINDQSVEYDYLREYFKEDLLNVYDTNDDLLIENFISYCRSYLFADETRPFVLPTHYTTKLNDRFAKFNIDAILPGSVKIRLNSNPEHVPLFRALAKYKNKMYEKYSLDQLNEIIETLEHDTAKETDDYLQQLTTQLTGFVDVNVSDMWLYGGNRIDQTQTMLAEMFGVPIDMDKAFIENIYNPNNRTILVSIFGESYLENSYETNKTLLINYVTNKFRQSMNA